MTIKFYVESDEITEVLTIHPQEDMNICTKFRGHLLVVEVFHSCVSGFILQEGGWGWAWGYEGG